MKKNPLFSQYKEIMRGHAERLRMVCGLHAPPFELTKLLSFLGAELRYEPLSGLDGFVEPNRGGSSDFLIHINSRVSDNRQRFTLAHEIGHILLMKHATLAAGQGGTPSGLVRYRKWQGPVHCSDPTEDPT